jgi:hypothetical protein
MDRCVRPVLGCLFAISALAAAPACLAQQATATERPPEAQVGDGGAAPAATKVPRSAFGKVMSLLISALQQNADGGTASRQGALDFQPAAVDARPARDIQVSAAFQLAPPGKPAPQTPATASID